MSLSIKTTSSTHLLKPKSSSLMYMQESVPFDDLERQQNALRKKKLSVFDDNYIPGQQQDNNNNETDHDEVKGSAANNRMLESESTDVTSVASDPVRLSPHYLEVHVPVMDDASYSRRASLLAQANDNFMLETDDFDEDDLNGNTPSYISQKEIPKQRDFFEALGTVPHVDDISIDATMLEDQTSRKKISYHSEPDGASVDPLTGEKLGSDELLHSEMEDDIASKRSSIADESKEHELEEQFSELQLSSSVEEASVQVTIDEQTVDVALLEDFFKLPTEQSSKSEKRIDFDEIERQEELKRLQNIVVGFLNRLIDHVVNCCEYVDPNEYLRHNLDIMKLYQELKKLTVHLFTEKRVNEFLNRQAVLYFRRKKMFRALVDDPSQNAEGEVDKLDIAMKNLDMLMGRVQATEEKATALIEKLEQDVDEWEKRSQAEVAKLHDFIRQTILRQPSERLAMVLDREFKRMAILRHEISETRFKLIQRQHTMATLIEQTAKLETIGPNLMMSDYENLQRETMALDKKIEERNADLTKLQLRYHSDLHIMGHTRETQKMLEQTLERQHYVLDIFQLEKQTLRERIHDLKLERIYLRNQIRELSFQGGLIDKPALMFDYDDTAERLDALKEKVAKMRAKLESLQRKIASTEASIEARQTLILKRRSTHLRGTI